MSKMLKLTAGKLFDGADSSRNEKEFDEAADKFEKLPIFYLTYFSSTKVRSVCGVNLRLTLQKKKKKKDKGPLGYDEVWLHSQGR